MKAHLNPLGKISIKVKANEALYEDKAKLWLKREKDEQAAGNKVVDYEDDNQVPNENEAKSGSDREPQGKDDSR